MFLRLQPGLFQSLIEPLAQTDLAELVRSDDIAALELAWAESAAQPTDVSSYCQVIQALCGRDLQGKALALTSEMVDALDASGRTEDARTLCRVLVEHGAHNDKLAQKLFGFIESLDGGSDWYESIKSLSSLASDNITAKSLTDYERFRRFTEGHVLYHRAGWGEGLVTEFRQASNEIVIDFVNSRTREMPLQAAIESLTPLADEDLRTMRVLKNDVLQDIAKQDPSLLIRKVAQIFRGKVTSSKVKETLSPSVIPTKSWNSFWKRAKAAAAHDPWLQIEGSTTRPVFVLRNKPLSLVEDAQRQIDYATNLAERLRICRSYLSRCHDDVAASSIVDLAGGIVEASLAKPSDGPDAPDPAHLMDGVLLLSAHGRETSVTPGQELSILLTEDGSFHPENLNRLLNQESRDQAVSLLPEALGENWAEACAEDLPRFPADTVEAVIEKIVEAKKGQLLLGLWETVAPYPRRHPMMTYMMGCLYADGLFEGAPRTPEKAKVGRVLLHLVRTLTSDRKGDPARGRLLTRLVSLLTGRRNFLEHILEGINKEDCAVLYGISERGGPDFPTEIGNMVLRTIAKRFPELTNKPDKPFWESDANFVTQSGLDRYQEEYRVLVEEKIPANSTAIGVAASHGDISENSEWDAAMEEQRNLTDRATAMSEELLLAKLIEDQLIPTDTVSPGTRVTFTDLTEDAERTVQLLGPWDVTSEAILNYKAPLGQALLGMKPGQVARLEMGGTIHDLRVEDVSPL